MAETIERVLPLEGIHNFRDYGGYGAKLGKVRSGLLWRSGQHRGATAADLAAVAAIGLAAVIDLRGARERNAMPCKRPADFAASVVFVDDDTTGLAPHIEAAFRAGGSDAARRGMTASYAELPFRKPLVPVIARYFETLAAADGPTLVHCVAGKDRTGLAVALLHTMLGVHRDDVIADFLLTNSAGDAEGRIAAGAYHLRKAYGDLDDASVRVLMCVEPDYLDTAFAAIVDAHGSIDAYLTDRLGVTPERRNAIEERLIG